MTALPEHWHVTPDEAAGEYPCDRIARVPVRILTRGIDIDAPASVTFRWLCQLRVAPYSYDWIDNRGRTSPRTLTPGLDRLALGQRFLIGVLADFVVDEHITLRALPAAERFFGLVAMTYRVRARGPRASRLVVRLLVHQPTGLWRHIRYHLLAWGDLIMMRKELRTLRDMAEHGSRRA